MKTFLFLLFFIASNFLFAQNNYNKALADSLGADDNGMKKYYLVILKTGIAKIENKSLRDSLFKGHFENISNLSKAGKLIIAGPFSKNQSNFRGLFIINASSESEVKELLLKDPTIKEKIFDTDIYEWYGSAAIPMYIKYHNTIEKTAP